MMNPDIDALATDPVMGLEARYFNDPGLFWRIVDAVHFKNWLLACHSAALRTLCKFPRHQGAHGPADENYVVEVQMDKQLFQVAGEGVDTVAFGKVCRVAVTPHVGQ